MSFIGESPRFKRVRNLTSTALTIQTDDSNNIVLAPNKVTQITLNPAANIAFNDYTTTSKVLALSLSGNSASTTLTLATTQTTSQTLSLPNITGADTVAVLSLVQTLTNKTLTTPTLNTPVMGSYTDFTEISTPGSNPSSGVLRVYSKSGDNLYILNSSGTESKIATGTAVTYSRGDTATTVTITALSSTNSLQRLTGSTATTLEGIVAGNAAQQLSVYNVSTALVSISNQNASATAANRIITPSGLTVDLQPQWTASFVYDDSQSRWILTGTTSTQEWTSYIPTITGFGTVSNNSAYYKVLGDSLFVRGSFTTGTGTASIASISIPSQFTISSSKLSLNNTTSNQGNIIGLYSQNIASTGGYLVAATGTSTSVIYFGFFIGSNNQLTPQNGTSTGSNSLNISYQFEVPLV